MKLYQWYLLPSLPESISPSLNHIRSLEDYEQPFKGFFFFGVMLFSLVPLIDLPGETNQFTKGRFTHIHVNVITSSLALTVFILFFIKVRQKNKEIKNRYMFLQTNGNFAHKNSFFLKNN